MNPLPIIMAVESIIKRLNKEEYKINVTKITRSHRDKNLLDVQVRLSERLFSVFYDNYIESYSVECNYNVKELYQEYSLDGKEETGIYETNHQERRISSTLLKC